MTHFNRKPLFDGTFAEACCYGRLHPQGKVLPLSQFHRDSSRVNKHAEFCMECSGTNNQTQKDHSMENRECPKCHTAKPDSDFAPKRNTCKACISAAISKAHAAKRAPAKAPSLPQPAVEAQPTHAPVQAPLKPSMADDSRVLDVLLVAGRLTTTDIQRARELISR
jgi:hypothetical protein